MQKNIEKYVAIDLKEVEAKYIITSKEQSKDDNYWLVYSPEIVEIIDNYIKEGKYPYNSDIENLVQQKLFPHIEHTKENRVFSHIVYTSQGFRQSRIELENEIIFENNMKELGFFKATNDILQDAKGTKQKFYVVMNATNILGSECKKIVEKKFKLSDWGELSGGLHWMAANATRKGYKAYIGQFIKSVN
jgi:hypothetical protein